MGTGKMVRNTYLKAFGGAIAALLVSTLAMPGAAQAQDYHECDVDPDFGPIYTSYGCGETAQNLTGTTASMAAAADALMNQQLNFGNFSAFVAPTGRVRHTIHNGLIDEANGTTSGEFEVDEASFFGNASYDLPGTYFGGKVRVSGLVGWTGMTVDNEIKSFKTETDSIIFGGSYLWSQGNFYTLSTIIGLSGEVDGQTTAPAVGTYDFGISGYFTNSVYGYTFDMAGGMKFDLRGNISSYDVDGDSFTLPGTGVISGSANGWAAGLTGTIFTIMEMDSGVARPYLSAQFKQTLDEDIEIRGDATVNFDQDDSYGKLEGGYDFVSGPWTFGAAAYTEFSGDQYTVGGRMGVSVKLQ